jgi:hypothetical protein
VSDASDPNELENQLRRLIDRPIQNEHRVLEILVEAILSKSTDLPLIEKAVKQTVLNYEMQLRVFMVGVANRYLSRCLRLITQLDQIEERLNDPDTLKTMNSKDLIKVYSLAQSNLTASLEYVKKVVDMRLELQQAQAAVTNTITGRELAELEAISGLPKLSTQQRDTVRKIVEGLFRDVKNDIAEEPRKEVIDIDAHSLSDGGSPHE